MRKRLSLTWLPVSAVLVATALHAQVYCTVSGAAPPIVRAAGMAEQTADVVLNCNLGIAPLGQPIPKHTVTLKLNTNITSRLLPIGGNLSEALLTIEEPFPGSPVPSYITPVFSQQPPQILCTPLGSSCSEISTGGASSPYLTQPNVFVGRQIAPDTIQWTDVPLGSARYVRITNVRANATQAAFSNLFLARIIASLFIDGTPQQPWHVAFVQPQPDIVVSSGTVILSQCVSHNTALLGAPGTAVFDFHIDLRESFASTFRVRNYGAVLFNPMPPQLVEQNVLGFRYITESGFYSPSLFTLTPALGLADFGTRILLRFSPVSAGAHLFVPVNHPLLSANTGDATGNLQLVQTDPSGNSTAGYVAVMPTASAGAVPVAEVNYDGATAYAVYEVVSANPNIIEAAEIPVAIAFTTMPPSIPASSQTSVNVSLAPLSGVPTANGPAPLPRFSGASTSQAAYTINGCLTPPIFPAISANPSSLSFVYTKGGPLPAPQSVQFSGTMAVFRLTNRSGSLWLVLPAGSHSTPATLSIGVNPVGLAAGVYDGQIGLTTGYASLTNLVKVRLTVYDQPQFVVPASSLRFTYQIGEAEPPPQSLYVTASGRAVSLSVSMAGGNWLDVEPTTANTPVNLTVRVHPAALPMGVYTGSILISSQDVTTPLTLPVTLVVNGMPPAVQGEGVLNSASLACASVAPGEIIRINGRNLSSAGGTLPMQMDSSGHVSSKLGDTRVMFDGIPAPLLYVRPDQLSAVVPYELAGRMSATMTVECGSLRSTPLSLTLAPSAPGVYTVDPSGSGQALALNQDGSVNSEASPARRNSIVSFYLTGTGQTKPGGTTGSVTGLQPPLAAMPVSALIDGKSAEVKYAGAAPGFVSGLTQMNVEVPPDVRTGPVTVVFRFGDARTQDRVTICVR